MGILLVVKMVVITVVKMVEEKDRLLVVMLVAP